MKFTKRFNLNRPNPFSKVFAILEDGTIVTTSKKAFQLPSGTTPQRPSAPVNGDIRFNTTTQDTELYNISGAGTGWEKIKTNRQTPITPQNLGVGDYENTIFGPLAYDVDVTKPQNIMVFVDNVYQIPTTNYSLVLGTSVTETANTNQDVNPSDATFAVDTTADILVGQTVTAPSGLAGATTVTNVDVVGKTITIDPPATGVISSGTALTFTFQTGTFVQFSGTVPAKPVFTLLGFDGYAPPNS